VRSPGIRAQINGAAVDSIMYADITKDGSCKTSRFELTISTSGATADSQWLNQIDGKVQAAIYVRMQPDDAEVSMFEGMVDSIAINPIAGTAQVFGRDYSSVLVSTTYQDSFCNQTASEIATCIAERHGFTPNITATSTMVGSYLYDGYNQVLLNVHSRVISEWDLLTQLARSEGFQMFVDGSTLVFAPAAALSRTSMPIEPADVIAMKFHQICPVSDQTTISVKSWNSWLGQALSYSDGQSPRQSTLNFSNLSADPGTEIAIVRPNLSSQDAELLVTQHLNLLNEMSLTIEIDMPGETVLQPGDLLTVASGNAMFDGDYIARSVRRRFSAKAGFVQSIHGVTAAANPSPQVGS